MADRVKIVHHFTVGADPELFLADVNGHLRASCGLIGGTKDFPQPIPQLGDGYAVQEDNVAVEFNIPPARSAREFVDSISRTVKMLGDGINVAHGLYFDKRSAASFPKAELESPAAQTFGCDPDFNVWTGRKNPRPKAKDETLRSAGGHVHVGFDRMMIDPLRVIKCMDMELGVPSVLMDTEGDRRRQLYGGPGAFRDKPAYGVEYRTLSNFWVLHPELCNWVWRATERALEKAAGDFPIDSYKKDILAAIGKNDKNAAWTMVSELGLELVHV